jgi:hypothetical protein
MRDNPIYVVVGTVYENNEDQTILSQEFVECETYEQANEQMIALEKQLKFFNQDKKVTTWINQF